MSKVHITGRVDKQLVEKIKAQAKIENRPFSNMVETLLREAMMHRQKVK